MLSPILNGLVVGFMIVQSSQSPPQTPARPEPTNATPRLGPGGSAVSRNYEGDAPAERLVHVKRIYVDSFGDQVPAKQIQAMVINSLSESRRFVVTENREKADAVLKGSTLEQTSQELHSSTEVTVAKSAAIADASKSTETVNQARIAVRLVDVDGDVIWTSTQESKGAKYKSASADVADKVVRQLLHDLERLEKKTSQPSEPEKKSP